MVTLPVTAKVDAERFLQPSLPLLHGQNKVVPVAAFIACLKGVAADGESRALREG